MATGIDHDRLRCESSHFVREKEESKIEVKTEMKQEIKELKAEAKVEQIKADEPAAKKPKTE